MDEKNPDLATVLSSATASHDSLTNGDQDPAFIDEFTPLPPKEPEQEAQEEDEYVTSLLARENSYHQFQVSDSDKASIQRARLHSIQWLLQTRARLGLGYRTAYLSIMYFDRVLSLQLTNFRGREWTMRLLMVTCVSLAAKMEEVKIHALSTYADGDHTEFSFGTDWIKRMELRVLNALRWEMQFISPFPFVSFFLRNLLFQPQLHVPSRNSVSRAALIIFKAATVNSTMDYEPSVMAMAAALLVIDSSLSKAALEAKISASWVSGCGFAATTEEVHSCYEMIKKQVLLNDRALLLVKSSLSSPSSPEVGGKRNGP